MPRIFRTSLVFSMSMALLTMPSVPLLAAQAADQGASPAPSSPATPAAVTPSGGLHYLNPGDFLPQRTFAQPPALGSDAEALEMARIRALIAGASPERRAQARWDSEHENPTAFNATLGVDLAKLPATWALLTTVQGEADTIVDTAKDAFGRLRPYGVDPSLPTCTAKAAKPGKASRGYPSGHASMGYSVGWVLARLVPGMAPAILSRADDYALNREICAAHFHSDTEASHVIGVLVADRLLADPRLAGEVTAARAELAGAGLPTQ